MSQAHYEAVRLSSERPYTMGSSRKCLLPVRMRRAQTSENVKISHRFTHPNEEFVQQITHGHILHIGDNLLKQMQRNNERRNQQIYQNLIEAERMRMEDEYRQKSDEITRKLMIQLDEEKLKLQKEFENVLSNMENFQKEKNRQAEKALIQRMKDECDQALTRQWKLANEQISQAVKQAEDQLRKLLELKYFEDKEKFTKELIEEKEIEYSEREEKALEKMKIDLTKEYDQKIEIINGKHQQELEDLKNKLKLTEERFRVEFSRRARLESDFRLLQIDYKRFMDHSNSFHSDYLLKLYHIGEQVGDAKFEEILDRILTESNIENISPKVVKTQAQKTKHSCKLRHA